MNASTTYHGSKGCVKQQLLFCSYDACCNAVQDFPSADLFQEKDTSFLAQPAFAQ